MRSAVGLVMIGEVGKFSEAANGCLVLVMDVWEFSSGIVMLDKLDEEFMIIGQRLRGVIITL